MIINHTHIETGLVTEDDVHRFTAFASDIDMRAGDFPPQVETTLGNGLPFIRESMYAKNGDIQYVMYRQANGCITLKVFND